MDERMDRAFSEAQSRGLARDLGFNRRQMEGYIRPPPSAAMMANMPGTGAGGRPDFASADPSIMLPPSWSPVTSFPAATPDFDFAAGPGPTFTPPALNPRISGRGGSDALAAGNASPIPISAPPSLMPQGDPWAGAYGGSRPDLAAQLGIHNIANAAPEIAYDPLSSIHLPPPVAVPGTRVLSAAETEKMRQEMKQGSPPTDPRPQTGDPAAAAANLPYLPPPLPTAANAGVDAPSQAKTPEGQKRRGSSSSPSLLARIGNALVPGSPFGPGGGGVGGFGFGIGPGGFFSNAGSFTPSGAGGSSPFNMQRNGTMGTTTWRQGSVTGNPSFQGVMWNRSGNNGSVGYVTDPVTGTDHPIYTGSPNRF
jgi:hypothetical protein